MTRQVQILFLVASALACTLISCHSPAAKQAQLGSSQAQPAASQAQPAGQQSQHSTRKYRHFEYRLRTKECGPIGIVEGPDKALWFTESRPACNAIGRITTDGHIREFPLPARKISGHTVGRPGKIVIGPDRALWFTLSGALGRISTDGEIAIYPIRGNEFVPVDLTLGPDGALWFVGFDDNGFTDAIGRMTTNGSAQLHVLGSYNAEFNPWGITSANGTLWIAFQRFILRYSLNGRSERIPIPSGSGNGTSGLGGSIAAGRDGHVWFTDRHYNRVGHIGASGTPTLADARIDEPDPITRGDGGTICFGGFQQVGCLAPDGSIATYWPKSPDAGIQGITLGPDRVIWFTEYYLDAIGTIVPYSDTAPR